MNELTEQQIISLFSNKKIIRYNIKNTSHGDTDFREAIFAEFESGKKLVIKVASNAFTNSKSIIMWQRCIKEYTQLGYYCPKILASIDNDFPTVLYKGHKCIVYAEEYSAYKSVENSNNVKPYRKDLYLMTAKIADKKFNYTDIPSAYCLFDTFPGDELDEVSQNAIEFHNYCKTLPQCFTKQTSRMYSRWKDNRSQLEKIYFKLPTSVFQADFNDSNVLVNQNGQFVGIYDFNLAGKDELLNYLFREIYHGTFEEELNSIFEALKVVSSVYTFSEQEKEAALLIYRCVKPLWYTRLQSLKKAAYDETAIQKCLDEMEYAQTRKIDFRSVMGD